MWLCTRIVGLSTSLCYTAVFDWLAKALLTLKCEFGKAAVTYLGKQVGQVQVCPVDAKVAAIVAFPVPTTPPRAPPVLGNGGLL